MADSLPTSSDELKKLLAQQEKSAQMLIRRDLELARANDRLRQLDDQKSKFISVAAHQLRTPLSAIRWSLGYLLSGHSGKIPEEQEALLRQSLASTVRLVKLVNDLLGVDRMEGGRVVYTIAPVDFYDTFQSVLTDVLPNATKRGVTIDIICKLGKDVMAKADVQQLRLTIQNVVENAVKYTPKGGSVHITLDHDGDMVRATVEDTGIGIPQDQQDQIFKQFFRARNAVKMETDGTGLGLFLVKETVERMGGTLALKSVENKGTTVTFTLPVAGAPA